MDDIFLIPVLDQNIIYAPLYRFAEVMDQKTNHQLGQFLSSQDGKTQLDLLRILPQLKHRKKEKLQEFHGPITTPLFLGLITTRACNMACSYCDFSPSNSTNPVMTLELAQESVDMYLTFLGNAGMSRGQIEFFGGEPLFKNRVVEFVVSYSRDRSKTLGIELQFNVTTNGYMSIGKCEWVADNFDTVVLSLDGPAEFQNRNRPLKNGAGSFEVVSRSARILSGGNADLVIRCCINSFSVTQMVDIALDFAHEFAASRICFEPLTPSVSSRQKQMEPPDPYLFAYYQLRAQDYLDESGIELVTSGTDIDTIQGSFCPVGKDAIIVHPDGMIASCYLLEEAWKQAGHDLSIGRMREPPSNYSFDQDQVNKVRSINTMNCKLCQNCFARFHCAGGCHVNHSQILQANSHDRLCIQTRLIIIGKLLKRMKVEQLYEEWLSTIPQNRFSENQIPENVL
jgi:uncharacterized protein